MYIFHKKVRRNKNPKLEGEKPRIKMHIYGFS